MCCISGTVRMEAIINAYITRCGVNEGEIRTSQEMLTEERGHNWCQPDKYMYSYHLFPYNRVNLFQWSYKKYWPNACEPCIMWYLEMLVSPELIHSIEDFWRYNVGLSNRFFFYYSSWWGDKQLTMDVEVKRGQGSVKIHMWCSYLWWWHQHSVSFKESICFNWFEQYVMKITIYY